MSRRKINAAVLVGPRRVEVERLSIAPLTKTQMLVQVVSCGLCHSEVGRYLGKGTTFEGAPIRYPLRLGHEPAGIVADVGKAVTGFKAGDAVSGIGFRGAFADFVVIDFATAKPLPAVRAAPRGIPLEQCIIEPVKCAVSIVRHSQVKFGDNVFVAGCGFMGLLVIANLSSRRVGTIIACDILDSRLRLATELGATSALNSSEGDVVKEVEAITHGRLCDVAFEGIGKPAGIQLVNAVIRAGNPPGIVVLYAYHALPDVYDLSVWGQKAPLVINSHPDYSPDQVRDLDIAAAAMESGLYPMERLITHRFNLADTDKGFEALIDPPDGYIKGIVTP